MIDLKVFLEQLRQLQVSTRWLEGYLGGSVRSSRKLLEQRLSHVT